MLFYIVFFVLSSVLAQRLTPCFDGRNVTCTGYDSGIVATRKILFVHDIVPGPQATVSFTGNTVYFQRCNNNVSFAITANGFADPSLSSCTDYGCGNIITGDIYNVPPTDYGNGTSFNIAFECSFTSPPVPTTTTTVTGNNPVSGGNGNNREDTSSASILTSVF